MINAVYRDAFLGMPQFRNLPDGLTLAQMRARMALPEDFDARGVICVNGHEAPKALWGAIKPKAPAVTEVTFHLPPAGGDGGGKNILQIVAAISLTALTGGIAAGSFATAGGLFTAGSTSALLLAGGVSYAGSLLLSSLIPPPSVPKSQRAPQNEGAASANGNVLEANGPIPRVIGERKVYPPLAGEPLTYFDGPDEIVEAVYVLAGPHQMRDFRVGAAEMDAFPDVLYETRDGWPGDSPLTLVSRQSKTEQVQAELRGFLVATDEDRDLDESSGVLETALPQAQIVATRDAPDEHQLQLIWPQGLYRVRSGSSTPGSIRVPLRLMMRALGSDTWVNLPELHYSGRAMKQCRATIRIRWDEDATVPREASDNEGWVEARIYNPAQTSAPVTAPWEADPYFVGAFGSADYMDFDTTSASRVRHVTLSRHTADIVLDPAVFPRGRYEFSLMRGASLDPSLYHPASYRYGNETELSADIWDLYGYQNNGSGKQIADGEDDRMSSVMLLRSVSIWDEHPLPTSDLAAIAVRARNRQLDAVSCIAGGYVLDWDGTGWNDWTVTDNPAPHFRDIFIGRLNIDPPPVDVVDDDMLTEWRQHCIDMGYTCNALIEDMDVNGAASIVAACGYAKPYMSEIIGVVRDYDRSAEAPVQIFSPRNIAGYRFTKAFPRVPEGFRVSYRDALQDYDTRQITVYRPGGGGDLTEQVTYEGIVQEADVRARALYDQAQAEARGTFHVFDAPAEGAIVCRRGNLIGLNHDSLSAHNGSARMIGLYTNDDDEVTAIEVDAPMPISNEPDMLSVTDVLAIADVLATGAPSGVAIRRRNGITVHELSNATGSHTLLELAEPTIAMGLMDDDGMPIDALVTVGPHGREYLRLIVFSVQPRENFEATFTCVDEAPELWSAA